MKFIIPNLAEHPIVYFLQLFYIFYESERLKALSLVEELLFRKIFLDDENAGRNVFFLGFGIIPAISAFRASVTIHICGVLQVSLLMFNIFYISDFLVSLLFKFIRCCNMSHCRQ